MKVQKSKSTYYATNLVITACKYDRFGGTSTAAGAYLMEKWNITFTVYWAVYDS